MWDPDITDRQSIATRWLCEDQYITTDDSQKIKKIKIMNNTNEDVCRMFDVFCSKDVEAETFLA
jgi:hypothetical protein